MKKVFILMLGLVASTASFAHSTEQPAPVVNVHVTPDQKLKLIVGPEEAKATIVLRDVDGRILYNNSQSLQNGLAQKFNLNDLANGTYKLSVTVSGQTTVKTFEVGQVPAQTVVKLDE